MSFSKMYFGLQRLSITELKILLHFTKQYRVSSSLDVFLFLSYADFSEAIGHKRTKAYEINMVLQNLALMSADIQIGDLTMKQPLFIEKKEQSSSISILFNRLFLVYLIRMCKIVNDTEIDLLLKLKSSYSIMFYILIKDHIWSGDSFDVSEIKQLMGVMPTEYPLYGNFKARVLNPIIKELPQTLGIIIEFIEQKESLKVTRIQVEIRRLWQYQHLDENEDEWYDLVKEKAAEFDIDLSKALYKKWLSFGDYAIFAAIDHVSKSLFIKNQIGYMDTLLKSNIFGEKLSGVTYEEYQWINNFIEGLRENTSVLSKFLIEDHFIEKHLSNSLSKLEKQIIWNKAQFKIMTDLENIRRQNLNIRRNHET
ncbi:replication initiation protein [Paenibacillus sp. Leaf72]|uniref:replication initiation protein n=1 Tax=Paenibacillus sp. Leaf72 TaxID=1736234 RepID=UPI0006F7A9B5|nr:replication initiation protein [Paenibacillus sp. Leaf72]KQN96857.1 hypothetical protein ASF12_22575 [Paenibacillus sp. Leaf72]